MPVVLTQALRSRWLAIGVHAGLWLLVYLVVLGLRGRSTEYTEANAYSEPAQSPAPVARLGSLFGPNQLPKPLGDTNLLNLFYTRHFVPPPAPAAPPPPPPPTTRKVEMTYLGYYQAADSPLQIMVKMPSGFVVTHIGALIETNEYVAQATMQMLVLTNRSARTNLLPLNIKQDIEVPLK